MLTQFRLSLSPNRLCQPRPEWGYHLYSALLDYASVDFGNAVHCDAITPISQHLTIERESLAMSWTVNLLGEVSEQALSRTMKTVEQLTLGKDNVTLRVLDRKSFSVPSVDSLFSQAAAFGDRHSLSFCTATAFKSQGRYCNLPSTRLIVQSLISKWNGSMKDCPIEDNDGVAVDVLSHGLRATKFRLYDRLYYLKGNSIPGFTGELILENRLTGFHHDFINMLLLFSNYSGVGIKTALGMGGVEHRYV